MASDNSSVYTAHETRDHKARRTSRLKRLGRTSSRARARGVGDHNCSSMRARSMLAVEGLPRKRKTGTGAIESLDLGSWSNESYDGVAVGST